MSIVPAVVFLLTLCTGLTASPDCTGLADGNYMIDCQSYYVCNNGTSAIKMCPQPPAENILFNNVTRKCDKPTNVGSSCRGLIFDCSSKGDRDYADLSSNCTTFIVCYGGRLEGYHHCPADLVFHEDIQTCDWVNKVPPPCGNKV